MKRLAALLAALALLLTGCSSSGDSASPVPTTSTPPQVAAATTPDPSGSSTAWSVEEAGARYLAAVEPGNALIAELNKLVADESPNLDAWVSVCSRLVADHDQLARAMVAGQWPAAAVEPVAAFTAAVNKTRAAFQGCARAQSLAEVGAALRTIDDGSSAAAQGVRIALGLPGTS